LKQTNLNKDEKFRLDISKQVLFAKFIYSIKLLEDSMVNHPELIFKEKLSKLRKWKYKLLDANDIGTLFGLEGSFANIYYSCYKQLFPVQEFFKGRSKHPPKDEGNAVLSFINVLVSNRVASLLEGKGLDPYLGFLHGNRYGRMSLCYDIVEPLRPLFTERVTAKIFTLNMLQKEDFENAKENAVYLKQGSQKKFFHIYGQELKEERNYRMLTGNLDEVIFLLTDWLKVCIKNEKVERLQLEIGKKS
jgi:CRISPR-associated protein Cas1